MSHSIIASSSSSCPPQNNYDIFLSFTGDTRNNFTSHLHKALWQNEIHTFLDDDEMERGKAISAELQKAIEGSRCSVVILSPDYASSHWCLDELVLILQCMKESKQIVLPIFYHVDPSHVRNQTGSIGEAFKRHEQVHNLQKVNSWRAAYTEVGNLAGSHLQDDRTNEAIFIEDFIEVVSSKLGVPVNEYSPSDDECPPSSDDDECPPSSDDDSSDDDEYPPSNDESIEGRDDDSDDDSVEGQDDDFYRRDDDSDDDFYRRTR